MLADSAGTGAASVLGGIALVIAAIGGIVATVVGLRRPAPQVIAPTTSAVWVETLHQLDLVGAERDELKVERDDLKVDNETIRAQLAAAQVMVDFYRRQAAGEGEA